MYAGDTIAAIATPHGPGGVGIVRVSGPLSTAIAARVFAGSSAPMAWESHHLYLGRILDAEGHALDQALAVLMRAPRSYTGEDVLEFHCHGSPVLLRQLLGEVLRAGARLAEPGEFTRRAFLNGRLDLVQAEAVLDLVRARTAAGARLAARQLSRHLSDHLARLRTDLVGLKALLEAQIDFAEDDVDIPPERLISTTDTCTGFIQTLLSTFDRGILLRDGVRVTIMGKPNVGKSSLLNALLGEERAIVTSLPGTTRDSIEESIELDGLPVILTDTAGLRDPDYADPAEQLGMERTSAKINQAQLLLTVVDASAGLDNRDHAVLKTAAVIPHIVVLNKIDLPPGISSGEILRIANGAPVVHVSAKDGTGLDLLRQTVVSHITSGSESDAGAPLLTNVRHRDALEKALHSLLLARTSMVLRYPPDVVAVDVQDAIDHVGVITGIVSSEDVLDRVFSDFCIGK